MSILPFFQWMEALPLTESLREVPWFGAMINVMHLVSLVVFAGGLLIVDIRLMGGGLTKQPLAQVAREARPWLIGGFVGLVITGIPQLMLTAIKEYYAPLFWFKMEVMLVALIFTFVVRHNVTMADEARLGRVWGKVVGIVSIALWSAVAIPARLIGLVG
jgi:hypothetical protein